MPGAAVDPDQHMANLRAVAHAPLEVSSPQPCRPYHQSFQHRPRSLQEVGRQAVSGFATKDNMWSNTRPRATTSSTAGYNIENMWSLRAVQKSRSEPRLSLIGCSGPRPLKEVMRSSEQFLNCQIGGIGGGLEGVNNTECEDKFVDPHQGKGKEYEHFGLPKSDVSILAEYAERQKHVMRK
jgi:hypothetical protein